MKKNIFLAICILFSFISNGQNKAFKVEVVGKGQPIILIPGYSCSGDVWKETVEQLKSKYQCHVLTLAGFAGVPAIDTPILKTVRNEIIRYTKQNKLKKPILMGHSLGAFMSLWVSSEEPTLFGKVICVDGLPFISAMSNPAMTADSMKRSPYMNPAIVVKNFMSMPDSGFIDGTAKAMRSQVEDTARARQIATWQFLSDRRTLGIALVEMSTTDLRKDIAKIRQPVLMLGSIYMNKENSFKVLKEQLANLKNKTIKVADSKHFIMYDQPQWLINEITLFLK